MFSNCISVFRFYLKSCTFHQKIFRLIITIVKHPYIHLQSINLIMNFQINFQNRYCPELVFLHKISLNLTLLNYIMYIWIT